MEAPSADLCRIGEIVLIGAKETRTVLAKGSLIFRFPLEQHHPIGTVFWPMANEEFLREEEGRLCQNRKGSPEDIHFVCYVNLLESQHPKGQMSVIDEGQDRLCAKDLDDRIQENGGRALEARGLAD